MSGAGQDVVFSIGGTPVAGVQAQSFKRNAAAIDWRDRDSAGVQEFVPGKVSSVSLELSISGLFKDYDFGSLAVGPVDGWFISDASLTFPGWGTIAGAFFLSDYTGEGPYEDATKFSATLASNGAWTFTAEGEE